MDNKVTNFRMNLDVPEYCNRVASIIKRQIDEGVLPENTTSFNLLVDGWKVHPCVLSKEEFEGEVKPYLFSTTNGILTASSKWFLNSAGHAVPEKMVFFNMILQHFSEEFVMVGFGANVSNPEVNGTVTIYDVPYTEVISIHLVFQINEERYVEFRFENN